MKTAIFDIDGTLADISHRLHHIQKDDKDWDAFNDDCDKDAPYHRIIEMTHVMRDAGYHIVMCTGRSCRIEQKTMDWLNEHEIPCSVLLMRAAKDFRSDYVVKEEMLNLLLESGHDVHYAFEDRSQVVDMWREKGITTFQVKKGDY